ncbi:hypothetical protein GGP41_009014 [Bipolaris sorokiniana]|uniref:Carboxyltransferase domain-containing protein n=1 Tax=Cochliobolus sativus TaxID=45130 RepID=A0A8H6DTD0_COCSA|nr:hypothetical protein GGP41_009014 [Bipolaris sorokiniana]
MFHEVTRDDACDGIDAVLAKSSLCGPPINLDFIVNIVRDSRFRCGNTTTKSLESFNYVPKAIDVISGGSYTLIQDYPGRPRVGHGFGHAGPMDDIAFRAANILVGNDTAKEVLGVTLIGPELHFLCDASMALCGPPVTSLLDRKPMAQWSGIHVSAGQRVTIGKLTGNCRVYLAAAGGFPGIAECRGSKATCPMVNIGGYDGRPLRAGDLLSITEVTAESIVEDVTVPENLRPTYTSNWTVQVMPGPYETGFMTPEDIETFFSSSWTIGHNASRGGIRLIGARPKYARSSGGEGGSHPSNVIEYGYPLGGVN